MNPDATLPRHVIGAISYAEDRIVCTCNAVMKARGDEWRAHRDGLGLKTERGILGPARGIVADPYRHPVAIVRRVGAMR